MYVRFGGEYLKTYIRNNARRWILSLLNNVSYKTGKCYQSKKKTYHKIRYQSDELFKENKLSIIDEYYEAYKRKYKTAGKSWYEYDQNKKGNSWKSKLQFDINRMINKSKSWEEF